MSSLFDVPAQLAIVLTLAASTAGPDAPGARNVPVHVADSALQTIAPESAQGPYRFSAANWFRALKEDAGAARAANATGSIFCTSSGRFYVPAASERSRLLAKRSEEPLARQVALAFARHNAVRLRTALKRAPSAGDLYIAHILGPESAAGLIQQVAAQPSAIAAKRLPQLALAAPSLVKADGRELTLAQLYARLTQGLQASSPPIAWARPLAPTAAAPESKPTLSLAAQRAREVLASEGGPGITASGWQPDVATAGSLPQPQ